MRPSIALTCTAIADEVVDSAKRLLDQISRRGTGKSPQTTQNVFKKPYMDGVAPTSPHMKWWNGGSISLGRFDRGATTHTRV